jgi:hypothetical protein
MTDFGLSETEVDYYCKANRLQCLDTVNKLL